MAEQQRKTTTYLRETDIWRLDALARKQGISRAELLRRIVSDYVEAHRPERDPLPVFDLGEPMTLEEQREELYEALERKVARR
ncbi:ribbon-helix-helix protein, CopG family [Glycomyces buryatensis]|uniref:Ribbon-helix-helix protein, CopG family n=1 Tax=Glycomyces buryatensis TaxID=2570927 RepID=A0A4S8QF06_9ACTN|nr:ribbon-helix-helix protein, CopG family [Glycomyces buryatensis]THV43193.1 ribbon-helix-helix protein, CopG family [Glycomyces buryatensis]